MYEFALFSSRFPETVISVGDIILLLALAVASEKDIEGCMW